jgi:hypothetical protein
MRPAPLMSVIRIRCAWIPAANGGGPGKEPSFALARNDGADGAVAEELDLDRRAAVGGVPRDRFARSSGLLAACGERRVILHWDREGRFA